MAKTDNTYRIHTEIGKDTILHVPFRRDIDFLEILTLKLSQKDLYMLHASNYGVVVGRVLANDGFGVPNARISVFLGLDRDDDHNTDITQYYPYKYITSRDNQQRRYNLLADTKRNDCYRIVGTFPNKRLVLDNDTQIEIYDKYWKYTTVTNASGDYMIFGVPVGTQTIHIDIDLSNIGILSQKPRDFLYKGYTITSFDNANQFKESTNLDNLVQIIGQNQSVEVYPFWGDNDAHGNVSITRCDIDVSYKFETTCIFMGSIVSDDQGNSISHECTPSKGNGYNRNLIASEGTIEMIRETQDGLVEEVQIQGNELIDGDGVWCYQVPMNLDYVVTDEFGNIVPTDNPNKGIATRASVRFRVSINETGNESISRHRAKYLIPNNPMPDSKGGREEWKNDGGAKHEVPKMKSGTWRNFEKNYEFGSATPSSCFRNLYWNKVYTVKNYIPRIQTNSKFNTDQYLGIRTTNYYNNSTPFPFNNVRFKMPFMYMFICTLMEIFFVVIAAVNAIVALINSILYSIGCIVTLFTCLVPKNVIPCISISIEDDVASDGSMITYAPGCFFGLPKGAHQNMGDFGDRMQRGLAQETEVVNFDFYNDWINGTLYMPLWFWKKQKKKSYFFGLWRSSHTNKFCNASQGVKMLYVGQASSTKLINPDAINKNVHKKISLVKLQSGVIYEKTNKQGLKIYYYSPATVTSTKGQSLPFVRLFATDIVLLGSLTDCDLDSIPKMFDRVPTSTSNLPSLVSTKIYSNDENNTASDVVEITSTTPISMTGLDWTRTEGKPPYQLAKGLLLDLSCTAVRTYHKSIINTRRLCELGVTFDSSYEKISVNNNNIVRKEVEPDGLMTRLEIEDLESRAMFATLNHNGLDNITYSPVTKYSTYKLEYLYPIEFDGYLKETAQKYTNGKTTDEPNLSYLKFRFGTDGNLRWGYTDTFPMYNNSFYFFFGIKPGNTVLEKFHKNFYSECFNNIKEPFTFEMETKPGSWCIQDAHFEMDLGKIRTPYSISVTDSIGMVFIHADELEYSKLVFDYWVNDSCRNNSNVSDWDVAWEFLQAHGFDKTEEVEEESKSAFIDRGFVYREVEETEASNGSYQFYSTNLTNGMYTITITDAYGRSISKEINLMQSPINANILTKDLSDKYEVDTVIDVESSGKLIFTSFNIDNYEYRIKKDKHNFEIIGDGVFKFDVYKVDETNATNDSTAPSLSFVDDDENDPTAKHRIRLTIIPSNLENDPRIIGSNGIASFEKSVYTNDFEKKDAKYYPLQDYEKFVQGDNVSESQCLVFFVLTADEFSVEAMEYCGGYTDSYSNSLCEYTESDNIFNDKIKINSSDPISLVFSDSKLDVKLISQGSKRENSAMLGWVEVAKPHYDNVKGDDIGDMRYLFPNYTAATVDQWREWINGLGEIDLYNLETNGTIKSLDDDSKKAVTQIVAFELNHIMNVARAVTCIGTSTLLPFEVKGGSDPKLFSAYPDYGNLNSDLDSSKKLQWYVSSDSTSAIQANAYYATVVGNNYISSGNALKYPYVLYKDRTNPTKWQLNPIFRTTELGNYAGVIDMNNPKKTSPNNIKELSSIKSTNSSMYEKDVNGIKPKANYFLAHTIDRRLDFEMQIGKTENQVILSSEFTRFYNGLPFRYDENKNIIEYVLDPKKIDKVEHDDNKIIFKNTNGEELKTIDASIFNKDGVVDRVDINGNNLVVTFVINSKSEQVQYPLEDVLQWGANTEYTYKLDNYKSLQLNKTFYSRKPSEWGRKHYNMFMYLDTDFIRGMGMQNMMKEDDDASTYSYPIFKLNNDIELGYDNLPYTPSILSWTFVSCDYPKSVDSVSETNNGEDKVYSVSTEIEEGMEVNGEISMESSFQEPYDNLYDMLKTKTGNVNYDKNSSVKTNQIQFQYRIKMHNNTNHIVYTTTPIPIEVNNENDLSLKNMVEKIKAKYQEKDNGRVVIDGCSIIIPDEYSETYKEAEKDKFIVDSKDKIRLQDSEELRENIRYRFDKMNGTKGFYPVVRREYYDPSIGSSRLARKLVVYERGQYVPPLEPLVWSAQRHNKCTWKNESKYVEVSNLVPTEECKKRAKWWCYVTVEIPMIKTEGAEGEVWVPDIALNPSGQIGDGIDTTYLIGVRIGDDYYLNAWFVGITKEEKENGKTVKAWGEFFIPFFKFDDDSDDDDEDDVDDGRITVTAKWYKKTNVNLMFKRRSNGLWYHGWFKKSNNNIV